MWYLLLFCDNNWSVNSIQLKLTCVLLILSVVNQHILLKEYTSLLFYLDIGLEGVVLVFNATFNNISWRSDLLLQETGVSMLVFIPLFLSKWIDKTSNYYKYQGWILLSNVIYSYSDNLTFYNRRWWIYQVSLRFYLYFSGKCELYFHNFKINLSCRILKKNQK